MRILITGASGQLGAFLLSHLSRGSHDTVVGWTGSTQTNLFGVELRAVDLRNPAQVKTAYRDARPDCIIHSAALSRVDLCHANPDLAQQVNADGTGRLAQLASDHGARLVYVSTDLVFDGERGGYRESDPAQPLSVYGRSKLAGEQQALSFLGTAVARVSLLFGPSRNGKPSFFDHQCAALRSGQPMTLFCDEWRTPLSLAVAASALVALAASDVTGLLHVGGPERMSRWELGQRLARTLGRDSTPLRAGHQADATFPEPRPRDVSLDSSRWRSLFPEHPWPTWDAAVSELGTGSE